jgi:hypothetical protein
MDQQTRDEIKALREDLETQTAINIVEGINTVETLAALGHWMRKKRPPTPKEAAQLSEAARERWLSQVRHLIALAKKEPGGLDRSLGEMFEAMAPAPKAAPKARKGRTRGKAKKRSVLLPRRQHAR